MIPSEIVFFIFLGFLMGYIIGAAHSAWYIHKQFTRNLVTKDDIKSITKQVESIGKAAKISIEGFHGK